MDKFAVDIEKVLDDFEYNEGREESLQPVKLHTQFKTPASSYRRPAFEPINLSDADFAAAPISAKTYSSVTNYAYYNETSENYINGNEDKEDTPDLLDSKPAQNEQMPDITSVGNVSDDLDLISPNKVDDLPPVVELRSVADVSELKVKPVSFDKKDDDSESDLEEYLQNLVEQYTNKESEAVEIEEKTEIPIVVEDKVEEISSDVKEETETESNHEIEIQINTDYEPSKSLEDEQEISDEEKLDDTNPFKECTANFDLTDNNQDDSLTIENEVNENIENVEKSNETDSSSVLENGSISEETTEEMSQFVPEERANRPNTLDLDSSLVLESEESPTPTNNTGNSLANVSSPMDKLGKYRPFWVPDTEAENCMQCQNKFTVLRRRHHCRACGLVLCSKCCNLKAVLEYLQFNEARVCQPCFSKLNQVDLDDNQYNLNRQPNPNNPMEYCSTIPPLQQAASTLNQPPPSVLVPTGVLKREGRAKSDVPKQVIFSDGIRPGGDLTELDIPSESRILPRKGIRRLATPPGGKPALNLIKRPLDPTTHSYISGDRLPPTVSLENDQIEFNDEITEVVDVVKFAINNNLFVNVKRVKLDCCVNRDCWSVTSEGLAFVGQDEIAIVLEILEDELLPPQDIFHLINTLYLEASKGTGTVSEMCFTPAFSTNMFGSKDHGGFLYIRPTFQCTTNLLLPPQPYLIAILIHKWETPWARLFPLRLVLRLAAEYRYYPCPLVSIRERPPLYTDIGHTVMKLLVDFRKYSYSLATVRGLLIHMEDRQTTILFPRNRYDQVVRALNNSNDSVLAFGANLSLTADSHLVCIQGTKDENTYNTQAINIHNRPRKVTGASFVVFNGALKVAGLSGKSSIVEDGLMVHLPSDSMVELRTALRNMKDFTISCGPNDEETVQLQWTEDDMNFNVGVKSFIDDRPLDGVRSIRVHNGTDYPSATKVIRWTEVFILQSDEGSKAAEPLDISRVSESIAKATCIALVPVLDSLVSANLTPLSIRATIDPENVGYEAGSCGAKLPSSYMNRLDEELIAVLHQAAMSSQDSPAVLELIFRIMNHP